MKSIPLNYPCPCGSGKKYKICCFQKNYAAEQAKKKIARFTLDDGSKIKRPTVMLDSIPTHNKNGLQPNITKDQMMGLCMDALFKILQEEEVGMILDLVNRVIYEMDIVPVFTYREISSCMEKDGRFETYMMQICSLKGSDPVSIMVDKMDH